MSKLARTVAHPYSLKLPAMTRRIVRTLLQVSTASVLTFLVIFFLDRNFRLLPTALHEYLPTHHSDTVITDVTVTTCSSINVFSSCNKADPSWHRIEKDLYLKRSLLTSAYVHVQRKREGDLTAEDKVVVDLTVGRLDPELSERDKGERPRDGERWEARPAGLWVKRSSRRGASDSSRAVTFVDVLFGDDAVEVRPGWVVTGMPLLLDAGPRAQPAHMTIHRGAEQGPFKPVPRIRENGRFKIVQLADLHLSTGVGKCREAIPDEYNNGRCLADPRTMDFVEKILDEEKPDLVVLSGDQVNGETAPDAQTAIFKYAHPLIKRKIPYVTIFGNHDDHGGSMSRTAQMDLIESLPYSLSRRGSVDVDGVGNYYIEVLAPGSSGHSAITVYLLDTHAGSPNERKYPGYDWVKPSQIEWFRKTAQGLKRKHREYTHVHLDVAFIHIPLPEIRDGNITLVGTWTEPSTASVYNSGFHDVLVEEGVSMVSCGHDHVNEYCALSHNEEGKPSMWLCYAGGTGFGGYGGYGEFHRKIRVFDFNMNEARITTWKRVEYGENADKRIDEVLLVKEGRMWIPDPDT